MNEKWKPIQWQRAEPERKWVNLCMNTQTTSRRVEYNMWVVSWMSKLARCWTFMNEKRILRPARIMMNSMRCTFYRWSGPKHLWPAFDTSFRSYFCMVACILTIICFFSSFTEFTISFSLYFLRLCSGYRVFEPLRQLHGEEIEKRKNFWY